MVCNSFFILSNWTSPDAYLYSHLAGILFFPVIVYHVSKASGNRVTYSFSKLTKWELQVLLASISWNCILLKIIVICFYKMLVICHWRVYNYLF